ncbi:class E sortase [Paenarthrobacter sp. DKR-5]|uniref:class E sortase n=1 Tax=Paenarthrobacter sp. DKR-5 TaxID=2835535 RepID=UPI001BDCA29D|nr:class E sortase [Paenarthrobacter sp. DKR-5]MBT1002790.1 class E sortase [Paenarthrobacter sp. DKR-5]
MSKVLDRSAAAAPKVRPGRSRALFAVQVVGELVITAGVLALLFVAWYLWWTNVEADAAQATAVKQFVQAHPAPAAPKVAAPSPAAGTAKAGYGPPPVGTAPAHGQAIGVVYVPRLGADYSRPVIQGTSQDVLDTLGLGHYKGTAMPGELGNFVVAGHRQTHGAVLDNIHTLVPGDRIYVQTADGFYTYVFRNEEIVLPDRTDVLQPVPTQPGAKPAQRLMTMTSCNPRFGSQERIIAYSVFDSWQPLNAGPPAAIAKQVAALQGKG